MPRNWRRSPRRAAGPNIPLPRMCSSPRTPAISISAHLHSPPAPPPLPSQRTSWIYHKATGGGLIRGMVAHWRYIFDRLVGPIASISCREITAQKRRIDESNKPYEVDVEDHAFAIFELEGGVIAQVSSSWASRVKRDDLLQIQVDGTAGSAVCGLHRCFIQPLVATPRPLFDPERPQAAVFDEEWLEMPPLDPFQNRYREGWE